MELELAFILVADARPPDPARIVATARDLGIAMTVVGNRDGISQFELEDKRVLSVAVMPAPHPDAPHMIGGRTSPTAEAVAASKAHIIVTGAVLGDARERDTEMAILAAAVIPNVAAIGAMLGHGIAFHRADLFAAVAARCVADDDLLPPEIAIDLSAARESETRMSFLTHGLVRYGREEFFITCRIEGKGAIDFVMTMARWMLTDLDKQLPTGETVGRTPEEKLRIQRVPSPSGEGPDVIRLDLP